MVMCSLQPKKSKQTLCVWSPHWRFPYGCMRTEPRCPSSCQQLQIIHQYQCFEPKKLLIIQSKEVILPIIAFPAVAIQGELLERLGRKDGGRREKKKKKLEGRTYGDGVA